MFLIERHIHVLRKAYIVLVTALIGAIPFYISAYTMGSSQYRIDSDSINSGGTSFSTSSSYSLGSTVGEVGTGFSSSTSYRMSAGYWIPEDTYVSINAVSDIALGSINGLIGGQSTSSSSWNVKTNNNLGYQLTVVASTDPALKAPQASIPDYAPTGSDPDFTFNNSAASSSFGFSPEGTDIIGRYKDNGSVCNFGAGDTSNSCWDGFSTTPKVVSQGSSANEPNGATTTLKYRVHIGSGVIQDSSGGYSASITVTATAL